MQCSSEANSGPPDVGDQGDPGHRRQRGDPAELRQAAAGRDVRLDDIKAGAGGVQQQVPEPEPGETELQSAEQ